MRQVGLSLSIAFIFSVLNVTATAQAKKGEVVHFDPQSEEVMAIYRACEPTISDELSEIWRATATLDPKDLYYWTIAKIGSPLIIHDRHFIILRSAKNGSLWLAAFDGRDEEAPVFGPLQKFCKSDSPLMK